MKTTSILICFFIAQFAYGKYVPTPDSAMTIPLGEDTVQWKMGHMDGNRKKIIFEMVPEGQRIEAWREMLAQEITFTKKSLEKHLNGWKKMIQKADPKVEIEEIELSDTRAVYSYRSEAFNEYSVRIFLKGSDGVYAQAYHIRLSNFSEDRVALWKELIPKTTIGPNPQKG